MQCSTKWLHKQSRSHRLLASDIVEVPSQCRNYECNEERSKATLLERYSSLHIAWDTQLELKTFVFKRRFW